MSSGSGQNTFGFDSTEHVSGGSSSSTGRISEESRPSADPSHRWLFTEPSRSPPSKEISWLPTGDSRLISGPFDSLQGRSMLESGLVTEHLSSSHSQPSWFALQSSLPTSRLGIYPPNCGVDTMHAPSTTFPDNISGSQRIAEDVGRIGVSQDTRSWILSSH